MITGRNGMARPVVLALLLIGLAGCGDDGASPEPAEQDPADAAQTSADDPEAEEDEAEDADENGAGDAPWTQGRFDRTELPDGFPADIWLPSTLRLLNASAEGEEFSVTGRVPGEDHEALAATFMERLPAAGWEQLGDQSDGSSSDVLFTDGTLDVLVRVTEPPPASNAMMLFVEVSPARER